MSAPDTAGRKVTLTFDNGPDPQGTTATVLDLLLRRSLKASFFVTGKQISLPGARAMAERAHAEGHWIGNHTFNHCTMLGDSSDPDFPDKEIGATQELIGTLAHPGKLFRPYGAGGLLGPGLLSASAVDYLVRGKYSLVLWNCVPRDWEDGPEWVGRCVEDILLRHWSVVVLHDLPEGGTKFLTLLLDRLDTIGAQIVQEFPAACVPIYKGQLRDDVAGLCPSQPAT